MSHVALGRDDFMRVVFESDFFDSNPHLNDAKPTVNVCRTQYTASSLRKNCRCGGDPQLVFACLDAVLALLEKLRSETPEAIHQFVKFVGLKRNKDAHFVTIYYRKTSQTPLRKIKFP